MKLLLATKNRTKLMLYRSVLGDIVDIFSPIDIGFFPSPFKETLNDAQKNAEIKACAYAGLDSAMFVLREDTSLEIPALGNLPGPAVRRWGGEVSDDISDNDWIKLFQEKITPLIKHGKVECRKIHAYTLMVRFLFSFFIKILKNMKVILIKKTNAAFIKAFISL